MPYVALVVLNWNNAGDTLRCLASLEALTYPNYGLLVVDNGSTDDSVQRIRAVYPTVTLLETGRTWAMPVATMWVSVMRWSTKPI